MKLVLQPFRKLDAQQEDKPPKVVGDTIEFRGVFFDLSPLQEDGDSIVVGAPFIGECVRLDGQISVVLEYLYSTETAENDQPEDISHYTFIIDNGECPCPIVRKELAEVNQNAS